ncbi:precorrin-6A reductase [Anaerotignum faecicola]|nr:precorrin-6A reductase [Anaerotignum faecicola]
MGNILLFAGTSEGRETAEFLNCMRISFKIYVATEYGKEIMPEMEYGTVSAGRLDKEGIKREILNEKPYFVIDATHPFAKEASENIREACSELNAEYIRLIRGYDNLGREGIVYTENTEEAVGYLKNTDGRVFITTGSKDLPLLSAVPGFRERFVIRILPEPENLSKALGLGFKAENIICMQGPFSKEINSAVMKQYNIKYMLTKETSGRGGYNEKIEACKDAAVTPIVIGRPRESGYSIEEVREIIEKRFRKADGGKKINIIGAGCGNARLLTVEARDAVKRSGLIIGSRRILKDLGAYKKNYAEAYKSDDILNIIKNSMCEEISVLFSGDTGFFSGAKELARRLEGFCVSYFCGISSFVYFMDKMGKSYEGTKTVSLHGRETDFVNEVYENGRVFILLGGRNTAEYVCGKLAEYGLGKVKIYVGENLSYTNEKITEGTAESLKNMSFEPLSVMLAENTGFKSRHMCIDDGSFIRGEAPMTKSEVRAVSVAKLKLRKDSVLYDIGAGTGSVSVEAAPFCWKVFAVEKNQEALSLIERNSKLFSVSNIEIAAGEAPEAIKLLPPPTHVFIGGSGGNIEKIISEALNKNNRARFVVNAVTIETLSAVLNCVEKFSLIEEEILQINVSKARKAGKSRLMKANNPVYIISFEGGGANEQDTFGGA